MLIASMRAANCRVLPSSIEGERLLDSGADVACGSHQRAVREFQRHERPGEGTHRTPKKAFNTLAGQ
jgi:hypothetical protein